MVAAAGAVYVLAVVTIIFSLLFCIAMGIILLLVSARLGRNPDFRHQHPALRMVCKVAGILALIMGVAALILFIAVIIASFA